MKSLTAWGLRSVLFILLAFAAVRCDTVGDLFENDKEAKGLVEEVGADYLVVDAIRYTVTDKTEYEGVSGLGDLSVGDEVEIEYEDRNGGRVALEIELAGAEDSD